MNNPTMLVLNIAPALEEDLIDYLLSFEGITGFTSFTVHGHGEQVNLSVAEQVSGRRKRAQYEMILEAQRVPALLAGLADGVGTDIVYWQLPVTNPGRIKG